ncbi:hypothetical protein BU15DRAFT_80857 [Melanogaster broomeanus]|nr:hypothetical protein BU15DRAFT_80857 [Melanogaster broomeanus]
MARTLSKKRAGSLHATDDRDQPSQHEASVTNSNAQKKAKTLEVCPDATTIMCLDAPLRVPSPESQQPHPTLHAADNTAGLIRHAGEQKSSYLELQPARFQTARRILASWGIEFLGRQAEPQIDPALLDHVEQCPNAGDVMGARHQPNGLSHALIQIDPALLDHTEQHPDADDIVAAYHQRNGKPHVPEPERLWEIHNQQKEPVRVIQDSTTAHERSGNLNPKPQGTPVPSTVPTVATSDSALMGHAMKLCSYPHRFREVIERAKLIAQCECATKDPFPTHSMFLDQSSAEIINEALLECENVLPGYWPNYRKELGVLLWESLMTWHSTLKGKAHEVVTWLYNIGKHHTAAENQAEAETLIKGAVFLRDGIDDEGSTNNMAHPALATLVMEFFYGPASLGTVFPEVFSRELCAALDEYIQTSTRQDHPFEYSGYSKVFTGLLDLQQQIDTHEKHAARTKLLRVAWAQGGAPPKSGTVIPFSDKFIVVLD